MSDMQRGYFGDTQGSQPDRRWVQFSARSWLNKVKSREAGRSVYDQVDWVTIQHPGDNLNKIERPATDQDRQEFSRQYAAFKAGREDIPEGTLLPVLFPVNPEIVDNLRALKIHTVEQLAELSDTQLQSVGMGGMKMRNAAKMFLDNAEKGKDFHALREQIERLTSDREADKQRIAALEAALVRRDDDDEPRRGPGRPRKEVA